MALSKIMPFVWLYATRRLTGVAQRFCRTAVLAGFLIFELCTLLSQAYLASLLGQSLIIMMPILIAGSLGLGKWALVPAGLFSIGEAFFLFTRVTWPTYAAVPVNFGHVLDGAYALVLSGPELIVFFWLIDKRYFSGRENPPPTYAQSS